MDEYEPFRIRQKFLLLDEGEKLWPRCYRQDVEQLRANPPTRESTQYTPILTDPVNPEARTWICLGVREEDAGQSLWVPATEAAEYLDVSEDTINRRAVPNQARHIPFRIRHEEIQLSKGGRKYNRFWVPDLNALLIVPDPRKPKGAPNRFHS